MRLFPFHSTHPRYGRAILAACSLILCMNAAFPIYGASVINTSMVTSLGWDRSLLGLLVSVNMAVTGITAPLVGSTVNRFGARLVLIAGSLLLLLGASAMAFWVEKPWQVVVAFGILMGLAMSAGGFVANQACVAAWFDKKRARAFAVLYATMGVGGFVAAPLISRSIALSDWRAGWLVFIGAGALALFLAIFVVRDTPPGASDANVAKFAQFDASGDQKGSVYKSPALWLVITCIVTAGAGCSFYIAHGLALLHDSSFAPTDAAASLSLMAASTLLGNFAVGAFSERLGTRNILAAGLLVFSLGILTLGYAHNSIMLYAYAVLLGAGYGAVQVSSMALLSETFDSRHFAAVSGFAISMMTIASAVAPIVVGQLFDHTHTYMPSVLTIAALNGIAAVLMATNRRAFLSGTPQVHAT
ncbi:MFS transporter [Agrobacterium vitis]|uniref:MFS transporter n=1 Tax=Allorhizobium ampelinum TaxID=3025782 RepID=UPI0022787776|nr:MFS transporter [Allorhizobium ampelinum]MCF1473546.1 MFS transporter [Allorhizobium ampelinum]